MNVFSKDELDSEHLKMLVSGRESFKVVGVGDIGEMVLEIEGSIERQGLSCRVYTEYRAAALAGETLMGGLGLFAAAGIAMHNIATFNPDYEIGKNKLNSSVTVTYKK